MRKAAAIWRGMELRNPHIKLGPLMAALAFESAGFPLIYLYNLVAGRFGRQRESWLRTFYRVLQTTVNASSDCIPSVQHVLPAIMGGSLA